MVKNDIVVGRLFNKRPKVASVCPLTIRLFNIAMENDPFIDDFPIKTIIYSGFSMAMLVITRGYVFNSLPGSIAHQSGLGCGY